MNVKSSGTVSALTSCSIECLTALIFPCTLKWEIEYFLRKLDLFCVFLSITGLYIYGIWQLFDNVQFLQLMLLPESHYFVKLFMLGDLLHVGWYLCHSYVQCCKFKMQNRTCSCDQKAQRFCPLFPDIIQFLTWVINVFKRPVTTPPANFCIVENVPILILLIVPKYL